VKTREDVLELLELNKFKLIRDTNHYIYREETGRVQIVLSKTPSDVRAHERAYSEIRNKLKINGIEPVYEQPKKERPVQNFNSPRIVENVPTPAPNQTPRPQTEEIASMIILPMRQDGKTGAQMCAELLKRGILMPSGREYTPSDCSKLALKFGAEKKYESGPRGKYPAKAAAVNHTAQGKMTKGWKEALQMMTDIAMSNMSDETKRVMIKKVAEEL
jgi:hypothetical protein